MNARPWQYNWSYCIIALAFVVYGGCCNKVGEKHHYHDLPNTGLNGDLLFYGLKQEITLV